MDDVHGRRSNLSADQRALLMRKVIRRAAEQRNDTAIGRRAAGLDRPPLSFAQEQLWFLDMLNPGDPTYNIVQVSRLTGPLDVPLLRRTLEFLVARHDVLRTTFPRAGDAPYQRVGSIQADAIMRTRDLTALPPSEREARMWRMVEEEASAPFDLAAGPLLRVLLVKLAVDRHVLVECAHHTVADGWSISVFNQELSEVYGGLAGGGVPVLGELPVQYADFAVWQREWLRGEVLESALRYWEERLAGFPGFGVAARRPRPAEITTHGDLVTAVFSGELLDGLRGLARECGVSLFMVLVGAFGVVLSRYSGQEDVPVGTTVLGRGRPELERLVGLFVNVVVLRLDVSGDPSFRELLARVREVTLGAFDHQEVPFEKVVERLAPVRDAGRNPLFQVFLQLLGGGTELTEPVFPGVSAETIEVHQGEQFFDFALTFTERPDRLNLQVEYSVDLFDRWRVEGFVRHFERVLWAVVADPLVGVCGGSLLSAGERDEVLGFGGGPEIDFRGDPMHVVVGEVAGRWPDSVAAVCGDVSLSYRDLWRRSGLLAGYLRSLGVGGEDVVAVALERGVDVVVTLLGVLRAGAAFVVLDMSHPVRRLEFIISDTRAKVVVTSSAVVDGLPKPSAWPAVVRGKSVRRRTRWRMCFIRLVLLGCRRGCWLSIGR